LQTETRESDWISVVAARLRQQWPTIDAEPLDEMAGVLWGYENLRAMAPDQAADTWLAPVNPD
jgi:hypothetical protein